MKKIAIGCDSYGYELKETIRQHLSEKGLTVLDFGVNSNKDGEQPYYEVAATVAEQVSTGAVEGAVLICGTGMGMAIIANKFPGVYASVCENTLAAKNSRSINNSNVLTLGEMVTKPDEALSIVDSWLTTEFTAGWDSIQTFLKKSISDIQKIEKQSFGK